jgi:hypothetical protein
MKINRFTLINVFVIIIFFSSCEVNHYSMVYRQVIKSYKLEFINHFPSDIIKGKIDETKNGKYDVTRLFLLVQDTTENFNKLRDSITKISKAKYLATDTCLFIINKFTTEQNFTTEQKVNVKEINNYFKSNCVKNNLPIANFWGLFDNTTSLCKLPDSYNIYVLEAKSGLYWDEKHRSNGKYMPENWKHGYSKGVAMNDKTHEIIYWFVLW